MRFLEELVATPLARAVGWTLLHSLWEGAAISLALAAVLGATRSARARYAAACIAMLTTVAAIVVTFVRLAPEGMYGLRGSEALQAAPWNVQAALGAGASGAGLTALVPWLAPVWRLEFGSLFSARLPDGCPFRGCAAEAFARRPKNGRRSSRASEPGCALRGRSGCSNRASRTYRW